MDRDPAGVTGGTALSVVVSKCAADGVADGAGGTAERTAGRAADGVVEVLQSVQQKAAA